MRGWGERAEKNVLAAVAGHRNRGAGPDRAAGAAAPLIESRVLGPDQDLGRGARAGGHGAHGAFFGETHRRPRAPARTDDTVIDFNHHGWHNNPGENKKHDG